jgi:hypothetical protein
MSTSYTTGGLPVPAATGFGQAPSDAVERGSTGAGAAQTAEETTSGAQHFQATGPSPTPTIAPGGLLERCGPWCWLIGGILVLVALDALVSSGGGGS